MVYDFDDLTDKSPPQGVEILDPNDKEFLINLLSLAAIFKVDNPGDLFTFEMLLNKCRDLAPNVPFDQQDLKVAFDACDLFKKENGEFFSLK